MSRAPAFQFYYRDFVGDEHVMAMDLDTVGAHILLMCAAAASPEGCRIPASERALRNIVRNPQPDDWQRMKEQLFGKAWKPTNDGQQYESKRLREVIENKREFSRLQSERAQKRYRTPAEPVPDRSDPAPSRQMPQTCSPSPSPSPKPIKPTRRKAAGGGGADPSVRLARSILTNTDTPGTPLLEDTLARSLRVKLGQLQRREPDATLERVAKWMEERLRQFLRHNHGTKARSLTNFFGEAWYDDEATVTGCSEEELRMRREAAVGARTQ